MGCYQGTSPLRSLISRQVRACAIVPAGSSSARLPPVDVIALFSSDGGAYFRRYGQVKNYRCSRWIQC